MKTLKTKRTASSCENKWGKIQLISSTLGGQCIGLFYHYDLFALLEIVLLIICLLIQQFLIECS
jgi:hypothetical protein